MKKLILLFFATTLGVTSGYSQSGEKSYENSWFIQGQGGTAFTLRDNDVASGVSKKIVSPHAALSVGKFFSPVIGARLHFSGWESKNYMNPTMSYYKRNYFQTSLDALVSLMGIFDKHNMDRKFDVLAIAGAGYAYGFKDSKKDVPSTNCFVPRLGLQGDYKLSHSLSLNLEVTNNFVSKNFDVNEGFREEASILTTMLGLTYRFGKKVAPKYVAPAPVENNVINDMRIEVPVEAAKPTTPVVKVLDDAEIFFKINSAVIEHDQIVNVEEIVKYLNEYPRSTVVLNGFADKKTGNEQINERLSEERVDAVESMLIKKYGIAPSRISKNAEGDRVQPFSENKKNRVTIGIVTEIENQ